MNIEKLRNAQLDDGSFGPFHSMSTHGTMTTEKALRRMYHLDLPIEHDMLEKSIKYVKRLLYKKQTMPDRVEKVIPWYVFSELMFSAWLSLFNVADSQVFECRDKWAKIISASHKDGKFSLDLYNAKFQETFGKLEPRQRVINPACFYCVVLLKDGLDSHVKKIYFDYVMSKGIYYIYDNPLTILPKNFDSKETIRFLEAVKLVSAYCVDKEDLKFVKQWILDHEESANGWTMVNLKPDSIVFPKSISWRKSIDKENDINKYLTNVIQYL
jgi:hypothetical protein